MNIASDNPNFEEYVRNKSAYINFFVFILALYELQHFSTETLLYNELWYIGECHVLSML